MRKRRCLVLLGALCFAALCLGMAGCKEEKSNALHGFELTAIADTMEVGNVFTLPDLTVYDDAANTYAVEWSVVNEGAPIELVLGQFIPAKTGIYTVSATVVFEGESKTLSKDIDCVDTSAPVILRENLPENAIVGDEIDLGAVFVCDNSGTAEIGYTVYENGDRENPVSVTEEKTFTVENVGRYEIVITAEDASGNNTEETFFLSARTAPAEWEVESLDTAESVESFITYEGATSVNLPKEYVSGEVGGREGNFVKFTNKKADGLLVDYTWIGIIPRQNKAHYQSLLDTYGSECSVVIPIYIESAANVLRVRGNENDWYTDIFNLGGPTGWRDVKMPLENFVQWYDKLSEQFILVDPWSSAGTLEITFYIGAIMVEKGREAADEFEVESLDTAESVESFITYEGATSVNLPKEYVSGEVGGREGNFVKFTNKKADGLLVDYTWIGIIPRQNKAHYQSLLDTYGSECSVVIPIYIESAANVLRVRGNENDWYTDLINQSASAGWHDVEMPLENFVQWYDKLSEQFILVDSWNSAGTLEITFYIGAIYVQAPSAN